MKRSISIALAAVAALALALCLAGCSQGENYTPQSKAATVQDSQLVKAGTLTVGVNASNTPMAGQTSTYVGIDVDIAAAIADELGLKLSIVDVKTDAAGALENKTVDFVLGYDSTLSSASLWKSDTYLQTGVAFFSTKASAAVPVIGGTSKFSATASSVSAWAVTNQFGSASLTSTTDLASAFSNLEEGLVDYVAADAVIGMYAAHSEGLDAYIIAMANKPGGYCAAVSSSNTGMQSIVQTALKTVTSNGMVNLIEKKWLGTTIALSTLTVTEPPATTTATTDESTSDDEESSDDDASSDEE